MCSIIGKHMSWPAYLSLVYLRGIAYYSLIAAGFHALDYYRRYQEQSRTAAVLEAQLAQTKLHLLKMQLHPHFLFNTLNSISALLHEDIELADLMIERLGDFLRLTLEHSTAQEVTLREEMEFLECYLSIEQIRLQERLVIDTNIEPHTLDARVPSLILQPIVENAIRHGIAPRAGAGRLEIRARHHKSALTLTIRDDGPGLAPVANGKNGKGMGLSITRARLERLYGIHHRFELVNAPEGGLLVTLEIPFEPSNPEQVST
jgi:LytS/YehU family sensor histidine kinase